MRQWFESICPNLWKNILYPDWLAPPVTWVMNLGDISLKQLGRPYSLILLDEIERLMLTCSIFYRRFSMIWTSDGHGCTVDFSNCIIVMTSNLGSQAIQSMMGQDVGSMENAVKGIAAQHFRPEFVNRIDEMVVFEPEQDDTKESRSYKSNA